LNVIDLSHVYFAGEDQPDQTRREERRKRMTIRRLRKPGSRSQQQQSKPGSEPLRLKALAPLLTFILRQSGLAAEAYQSKALNRRFAACLRTLRANSEQAGMKVLQKNPELLAASLSSLLIGVSKFFRDEPVFEQLRRVVLPQDIEKNGSLRVYSAGCSGGQELYSVAIILDELGALGRSHLFGLDCRANAIEQAKSGRFAVSELRGMEDRRRLYFRIDGRHAHISVRLKQNTNWRVAGCEEFKAQEPWDLILFRNVAIYLQPEYANRVWQRLNSQLKPGGVMVTGNAERPPENLGWNRESMCVYRKPATPR